MEGEVEFHPPGIDTPCKTWYKVFGDLSSCTSARPLVVLHGGPGCLHDYLLPLADLSTSHAIPVVFYDQLGNGRSTHLREKAGDTAFWTDELFIAQLEGLLAHLGIAGGYDVLGQSWGGMLAARFATTRPAGLRRLVILSAPASGKLWIEAAKRLLARLPDETQAAIVKHEAEGTLTAQEYRDAIFVYYATFGCRVSPFPEGIMKIFEAMEADPTVYSTMYGQREFEIDGSMKEWSVIDDLPKINVPTLLLNGRYDQAQDSVMEPFFHAIPRVRWYTFAESSHVAYIEERDKFMQVVGDFLTETA